MTSEAGSNFRLDSEVYKAAKAVIINSNRTRQALMLSIIASVIAATACWNTLSFGYWKNRLNTARYVYNHRIYRNQQIAFGSNRELYSTFFALSEIGAVTETDYDLTKMSIQSLDTVVRSRLNQLTNLLLPKFAFEEGKVEAFIGSKFAESRMMLDRALDLCIYKHFTESTYVALHLEYLERLYLERVLMIQIPLFGVSIDVNDLGLLSGISLLIILIWLRYCARREYINLRITFFLAKQNAQLSECYRYLQTRQLFTVPKRIDDLGDTNVMTFGSWVQRCILEVPESSGRIFTQILRTGLFALPVFSHALIVFHDANTLAVGSFFIPEDNVRTVFWTAIILFVLIALFTAKCITLSLLIDKEWDMQHKKIVDDQQV